MRQLDNNAAVLANPQFQAYASAGVAWECFPTAVKGAFIPPNTVTRLKMEWESPQIKQGKYILTLTECFWVHECQLELHVPLCNEHLYDPSQLSLETNQDVSTGLNEKLESQPSVSHNEIVEHVSQGDAMPNSKE